MTKIAIRGYYGFGNLGDDLLMLSSIDIVNATFTENQIYICTESQDPFYIKTWLGNYPVINISTNINVDWIVHGGGGVFFDFKEGSIRYLILNRLIKLTGFRLYHWIYSMLRKLKGGSRLITKQRLGIGIGVGTYTSNSRKFYSSILNLSSFDFLIVRDKESYSHIKNYNFKYPIQLSTDIVFNTGSWLQHGIPSVVKAKNTVGIILRDWELDNHQHVYLMLTVIQLLAEKGINVKFYSFDKRTDTFFINLVKKKYPITIWEPNSVELDVFIHELAKVEMVITSRAHGAIVSACLGIPGICVEIEPKLRTVQAMLPNSYLLVQKDETPEKVVRGVATMLDNIVRYKKMVLEDVSKNKVLVAQLKTTLQEKLKEYE